MEQEKTIFSPEFIPFYVEEVRKYKLSPTEGLVYGFIRFYAKTNSNGFYFKSLHLSEIIKVSEGTINNCVGKLKKLGLVEVETENKGFKKIRKISLNLNDIRTSSFDEVLDLTIGGTPISLNDEIKKNNIKENNKKNNRKNTKKEKSFFDFLSSLKFLKDFDFSFYEDKDGKKIFEDEKLCEAIYYFIEMRKKLKAAPTDRAIHLIGLKARNFSLEIFIKMIEQSTENSWKGIFELKEENQIGATPTVSNAYEKQKAEQMKRLAEYKRRQKLEQQV